MITMLMRTKEVKRDKIIQLGSETEGRDFESSLHIVEEIQKEYTHIERNPRVGNLLGMNLD